MVETDQGTGLYPQAVGLDLRASDVAGKPANVVHQRGICACGHRVAKHRLGRCLGVPVGRTRLNAAVVNNECLCRDAVPVLLVGNARRFQLSWASAEPDHPLTASLRLTDPELIEAWLVETPIMCAGCGGGEGVRPVYQPGTRRRLSAFACTACAPTVNGV